MTSLTAIYSRTPRSPIKIEFLKSLCGDLRGVGAKAKYQTVDGAIRFRCKFGSTTHEARILLLRRIRDQRLLAQSEFVMRAEASGILRHFANGSRIKIPQIDPQVSICDSSEQFQLFRYCRLRQSYPTTGLVGRQIRAIIWDVGQDQPYIMGIVGLSSSPYTLGARDSFLGWDSTSSARTKDRGLRCVMQLSICMSLPPYHFLNCGKLVAALALSKPITDYFKLRYRRRLPRQGRLLALVATCAGGIHCPSFNRIMLRHGGLYQRIGQTAGYTTAIFSDRTRELALSLVRSTRSKGASLEFANSFHVLTDAIRECSIPSEKLMRIGFPKGIYLGYFDPAAPIMLRSGKFDPEEKELTVRMAFEQWASHVLRNRVKNESILEQMRNYQQRPLSSEHEANN